MCLLMVLSAKKSIISLPWCRDEDELSKITSDGSLDLFQENPLCAIQRPSLYFTYPKLIKEKFKS